MRAGNGEKTAWWLIQNARLVAVSPSLDESRELDDAPQWLTVLQERLRTTRPKGIWDDSLLYAPKYNLTLTFDEGSQRTIAFGASPPKLICACRVLIDDQERVVMGPGLPEYNRMTSRFQTVNPRALHPASTFPLGTVGILMSLIIYFIYLMTR